MRLHKVTLSYLMRTENGTVQARKEDVIVEADSGNGAASVAFAIHAQRLRQEGAVCDENGALKLAVTGIEPPTAEEKAAHLGSKLDPAADAWKVAANDADEPEGARYIEVEREVVVIPRKNKGGRPKGSKNKLKSEVAA